MYSEISALITNANKVQETEENLEIQCGILFQFLSVKKK